MFRSAALLALLLVDVEMALLRGLARDGYIVAFDENERPQLRVALPRHPL